MTDPKERAKQILKESGLRVTAPRVAVLNLLQEASRPLSHSEVLNLLGETNWDPATIYRNLVKLKESGITSVVSRAEGIDRYALKGSKEDGHKHPHFVCDDCGKVACVPGEITIAGEMAGPWAAAVEKAMVQLRGECPECIEPEASK